MKHLYLIFMFMVLVSAEISAQVNLDAFYQDYLYAKRRDASYFNRIEGTPYSHPDFSDALVYFRDNNAPVKGKLRYNELFDEMEMVKDEGEEFLIVENKHEIDSIYLLLNREKYRYLVYTERGNYHKGYLLQLVNGECKLFLKKTREFQPEKKAAAYQDYVPASIIEKPDIYFVSFGNNPPEVLPQSSKKIEKFFLQNGYNLSELKKKQKIRYNSDSLMDVVRYCNLLKSE